jgi:choline dehydrogenase-like flavoprotein
MINPNSFVQNIDFKKDIFCDYLVVGSGAGGSVAAYEISKTKDVLLIEEGKFFEINNFKGSFKNSLQAWRNGGFTPVIGSPSFGYGEGMCLGGGTYINGGLIWRTPDSILKKWNLNQIEGYDYAHLKKHFLKIEKMLNVVIENNSDKLNKSSQIIHDYCINNNIKSVYVPRAIKNCLRSNACATGCPSEAKQSVLQGYIAPASNNNLRILTNIRAEKIYFKNNLAFKIRVKNQNNKKYFIKFNNLILAAGPVQTPLLIKNSLMKMFSFNRMQIHLNLRIHAKFSNKIFASRGTIFTTQVQEFLEEGTLFMSTNFTHDSFLSSLNIFDNKQINYFKDNFDSYGSYVLQVKPSSQVMISSFFGKPVLFFKLNKSDLNNIKKNIIYFSQLLFDAGAIEVVLPINVNKIFKKKIDIISYVENLKASELQMLSVHGMSSCQISKDKNSFLNNNGQSNLIKNLYCVDASVLPSNIGESPQGTIMAFSHEISSRMLY